ncbi:MAG: DUF2723 domain-containing protein [Chloroflexi bacterium]|nr:DUF2723 domain-containing protein [Chloroflexota bacterium]
MKQTTLRTSLVKRQWWVPALLFGLSLALYASTLAPTVATLFDDSLELQLALPTFAIIHPTGYPLYSLLGFAFTHTMLLGDVAFRANLFSAVAASGAVALLYVVARQLGSSIIPAVSAAALLAVSPVWWSQATIAEVYALQGLLSLFVLYALLYWEGGADAPTRDRRLWLVGFSLGLGLTHHRMTVLLLPAAAVFMLWRDTGLWRRPRAWLLPLLALVAPLSLYGILPLRSAVGSLDGSYARIGFWQWVMGGGYSTFLRQNPFGIERNWGDLFGLLDAQYGTWGYLAALMGVSLWRLHPRRFVLLALMAVADLVFVRTYLVADYEVFAIPLFLIWPLLIAVGLTSLIDTLTGPLLALLRRMSVLRRWPPPWRRRVWALLAIPLLVWPLLLGQQRYAQADRSQPPARAWGVHDYGLDMLASMEPDAQVVGILGEMTLLRYFQRTAGIRPDVRTIAADDDTARLAAITASVASGHPTYTTRPLVGLPETMQLDASGPLVQVHSPDQPFPRPGSLAGDPIPLLPEVSLYSWQIEKRQPRSGPSARLTLRWLVHKAPAFDFKISARLLTPQGDLLVQKDDFPVHNSYPPTFWRPGDIVIDSYDLPLPPTAPPTLTLLVILYNPHDGSEIARWQQSNITF